MYSVHFLYHFIPLRFCINSETSKLFKARLPTKWMPPESLFEGISSTMSDV